MSIWVNAPAILTAFMVAAVVSQVGRQLGGATLTRKVEAKQVGIVDLVENREDGEAGVEVARHRDVHGAIPAAAINVLVTTGGRDKDLVGVLVEVKLHLVNAAKTIAAAAVQAHLENIGAAVGEMLDSGAASLDKIEFHGPKEGWPTFKKTADGFGGIYWDRYASFSKFKM